MVINNNRGSSRNDGDDDHPVVMDDADDGTKCRDGRIIMVVFRWNMMYLLL
jgi:hypothetical protein